jgi:hypothetical protein
MIVYTDRYDYLQDSHIRPANHRRRDAVARPVRASVPTRELLEDVRVIEPPE